MILRFPKAYFLWHRVQTPPNTLSDPATGRVLHGLKKKLQYNPNSLAEGQTPHRSRRSCTVHGGWVLALEAMESPAHSLQ